MYEVWSSMLSMNIGLFSYTNKNSFCEKWICKKTNSSIVLIVLIVPFQIDMEVNLHWIRFDWKKSRSQPPSPKNQGLKIMIRVENFESFFLFHFASTPITFILHITRLVLLSSTFPSHHTTSYESLYNFQSVYI